jgi:hypothetical protein
VWIKRRRRGTEKDYVPWGLIGGDFAGQPAEPETAAPDRADQMTTLIRSQGMVYLGEPTTADVVGYTHGLVQAIYKAYALGPACAPYEIAVGDLTTKLASCFPCTMFMTALGYPPTSTHLGRGESWVPLYQPYNPGGRQEPNEDQVIRDLNAAWASTCGTWLDRGINVLGHAKLTEDHAAALEQLQSFVDARRLDPTLGATLILDALTIHQGEAKRIDQTLRDPS